MDGIGILIIGLWSTRQEGKRGYQVCVLQIVCKACYHLLDIIDELQQTLAESKTDVRTKFLETIQKLRLKYPRTDKVQ